MTTQSAPSLQSELIQRFCDARGETDRLFGLLSRDSLYDRPIPERHRIIFYLGHLEAFDWNLLRDYFGLRPFQPELDQLFAFGIDPVDGGLPADQPEDWPSINVIEARTEGESAKDWTMLPPQNRSALDEFSQLLNIAIEHRLMHAETLAYMFHQLPYGGKRSPKMSVAHPLEPVIPEIVRVPPGNATLGLRRESGEFGWDNEFESHTVAVPAFSIDKYKVTNGQFLEFVADGGYSRRALWLESDWAWIANSKITHPIFWAPAGNSFRYRGIFAETPLPLDAPVYTGHAEASAFARWAGKELPTEAEWHRASQGAQAPPEQGGLWDPPAVGSHRALVSDYGVEGLVGTGWEWTCTQFAPFPGFRIVPAYPRLFRQLF